MATPKSTAQTVDTCSAYVELPIDFASTGTLAESAAVNVDLPKSFKHYKPVFWGLKEGETAFAAGVLIEPPIQTTVGSTQQKVRLTFKFWNGSAGTIDPPSKNFYFIQY